jgi:hypothetical protein
MNMTNNHAIPSSWKTLPHPSITEPLKFEAVYTAAEAAQILEGLIPVQMEDKWFIYCSNGWLHFHRSWTGSLIYCLRLEHSPVGVRVTDSWVNRDQTQYSETDANYDRQLVSFLIDALLLKRNASFPMPKNSELHSAGAVQHTYAGSAYPEQQPVLGDVVNDV